MQFSSFSFFVFFLIFFLFYLPGKTPWKNLVLLTASYIFYASFDYRFSGLLFLSTLFTYATGLLLAKRDAGDRRAWLMGGIAGNICLLLFFKYWNFFAENFRYLLSPFQVMEDALILNILLPVGISFFTFQNISYLADVAAGKTPPARDFVTFASFIAFFPKIIAGPLERANDFLPQVYGERKVTLPLFKESCFLILWGLFEKVVVADNLSVLVASLYGNNNPGGFSVLLGGYAFAVQIFADFDGYSNMAKGLAGLLGFQLTTNFNAPYFSKNPSEFWKRWHISLSLWLKDYLYIPLGGSRLSSGKTTRNLMVTMLLGGIWHGAGWMFVLWGGFHGVLLVAYHSWAGLWNKLPGFLQRLLFFHLICFGWLLFCCESWAQCSSLMDQLVFHFQLNFDANHRMILKKLAIYGSLPMLYQYCQYKFQTLYPIFRLPLYLRAAVYVILFYGTVILGFSDAQSFIYSKF